MVTFRVSTNEPTIYKKQSSSPGHYLNDMPGYRKMGWGKVLQESEWDADKVAETMENGFVNTVIDAYNYHHNLVLRPDDVWLAIIVQFSSFVNGNAGELRHMFVCHEGKKELAVTQSGASHMALQFVDQLRKSVKDPGLADWILPDFTTTTVNDTIVSSVAMMATMKQYYTYRFFTLCGIPEVTLLGSVEDWQKLVDRSDKLRSFGEKPAKWADMLQGVLRQFVMAAAGNPDIAFWERIYHYIGGGSGCMEMTGWISVFCVVNSKGQWQGDWSEEYPVIDHSNIPTGHVTVPVQITDNGVEYNTVMFAGHMLTEIVNETTLTPKATWAMVEEPASPPSEDKE